MEQHPIPQQITSYEFKLVGEMTLKQFLKAAGGILVAVLINSSHIVFFVKYPLMLIFAAGGLAMAFLPYQDRPLETWFMAFLKSIYSPTVYTYKKSTKTNWLEIDPNKKIETPEEEEERKKNTPIKNESKVKEFIQSLPSVKKEETDEVEEDLGQANKKKADEIELPKEMVEAKRVTKINEDESNKTNTKGEVPTEEDWRSQEAGLNLKAEKLEATGKAVFGKIPMPDIPDIPNLIVGMVTDPEGKIVEGAIVEIQDEAGNPSRVLKSNSLGQFRTSTPMANGRYLIITEKEGYEFDRVNVDLIGAIVQPVRVISKTKSL